MKEKKKGGIIALLPIGIFLVLYLGIGIATGDFYDTMPAIVAFLIALLVAFLQNRELNFEQKMKVCAKGLSDDNIVIMCLIFLVAGAFSGIVSAAGGVTSTVNLFLSILPGRFAVVGLFIIACFVSTSMGTSVGTIAALAPIGAGIANTTGFPMALCIAAVVCGAMFGDNLSIVSDTTIAAVRTQGCEMKDKFKTNFLIVLPAAIITAILFFVFTPAGDGALEVGAFNFWQVLPYILVLVGALCGINVFIVLIAGIVSSAVIGLATGTLQLNQLFAVMFNYSYEVNGFTRSAGINGMYDITVISIVVACIGALIKEYGGIDAVINFIRRRIKGKKGAQLGIAALVSGVDVATANNTIAIVMTGSLAKEISEEYGIEPKKTASILDIFASVIQGIIPYGAQLLYAVAACGGAVSAPQLMPYLFYPYLMAVSAILFIALAKDKKKA